MDNKFFELKANGTGKSANDPIIGLDAVSLTGAITSLIGRAQCVYDGPKSIFYFVHQRHLLELGIEYPERGVTRTWQYHLIRIPDEGQSLLVPMRITNGMQLQLTNLGRYAAK